MLNSVIFWKLLDMFILIIEWISLYILVNDLSIRKVSKNQNLLSFSLILGVSFAMNWDFSECKSFYIYCIKYILR